MSRRTTLAIVVAGAVLFAAVGYFAGQRIKSPAEIAADAEPPTASLITVPIELRTLSSNVVTRGDITFSDATDLSVEGSTGGSSIITRLPKQPGDQLAEGDVFIEVAGRPVFILQGELPTFRSFTPGLEGPDVRQLQESLRRLGFDPGPSDGTYSTGTENAVADLYRAAGYRPDEPSREEQQSLADARSRVQAARRSLTEAQTQLAQSSGGLSESELLSYDQGILSAKQQLEEIQAQMDADTADLVAAEAASSEASQQANAAADTARARLASAQDGVDPDGLPLTDDRLAQLEADVDDAEADASAKYSIWLADSNALAEARKPYEAQLESARIGVRIAEAQKQEALGGQDTSGLQSVVTQSRAEVTDAETALNQLDAEVGITFPAAEVQFLSSLPREVQRVSVEVGETPNGAVMTVTGAGVQVNSAVTAEDRRLIEVGAKARLLDDDLGIDVAATVTFVAEEAGTDGLPAERYRVRLEPDETLPEDAYLANVRVSIPVESTGGDVLAVPLAAVSAASDGTSRIEVERAEGETELVTVRTGLSAGGYVAIEAVGSTLSEGDRVVIGVQRSDDAESSDETDETEDDSSDDGEG